MYLEGKQTNEHARLLGHSKQLRRGFRQGDERRPIDFPLCSEIHFDAFSPEGVPTVAFVYVNADSDMTVKQDLHFSQIHSSLKKNL